jgi:hypothetical protein
MAVKTARRVIREQYGLEKGDKLGCSDFDAFVMETEYDIYGNKYQVSIIKNLDGDKQNGRQ